MRRQRAKRSGIYWRSDVKAYWFSFINTTGKRERRYGGASWDEAQDARAKAIAGQDDAKPETVSQQSFADVTDKFLAYQKPRVTAQRYEREVGIIAHLKEHLTGSLAGVTPSEVSDYVTRRLGDKMSKSTVRKELNSLKHLFRLACGEWKLIPRHSDPTVDIQSPEVHDERARYLTPEEFKLVLEACPNWLRPIVGLATATGMRRGEILGLRWVDIVGNYA